MNDTIFQPDSRALGAAVTDFARQLRAEMLWRGIGTAIYRPTGRAGTRCSEPSPSVSAAPTTII